MLRITLPASAVLLTLGLIPNSAQAQARVFVSAQGSDGNPCTFALPCRTFQHAHDTVAAKGEIDVLDPAGYGAVAINKAVSLLGHGFAGISVASGNTGITVDTSIADTVSLRGLILEGGGTAGDGIAFVGGLRLEISDCVIRNFGHDGINLSVGVGFNLPIKTFLVSNTHASDNGAAGIEIAPQSAFAIRGAIDGVTTANNGQSGILINATNATNNGFVDVAISNTLSESNSDSGITAQGLGNEKVEIKNSTLSNNVNNGLSVSNARVGLSTSSLVLNGEGFSITNSGTIFSFGDNIIENNRDPNTGTLTPVSRQ